MKKLVKPRTPHIVATANSMVEYALPVAIIGILLFGFSASFVPGFKETAGNIFQANPSVTSTDSLALQSMGALPYTQPLEITLSDGTKLYLNSYPSNLGKMVETVGADGTTELLLENIHLIAKQLRDSGKISESEYNQLEALANRGHRLGEIERLITANAEGANLDNTKFKTAKVAFDGQEYTMFELARMLGHIGEGDPLGVTRNNIPPELIAFMGLTEKDLYKSVGRERLEYHREFLAVHNMFESKEPALDRLLNSLGNNIASMAQFTASTTADYTENSAVEEIGSIPFIAELASKATHLDSASICALDGGTDRGIRCPKNKT